MRALLLALAACSSSPPKADPTKPPLIPHPPQGCPRNGTCTTLGDRCTHTGGHCECAQECGGGAAIVVGTENPLTWHCYPTPPAVRADGCPGAMPAQGTACGANMECTYGRAETGSCRGAIVACNSGTWGYPRQGHNPP